MSKIADGCIIELIINNSNFPETVTVKLDNGFEFTSNKLDNDFYGFRLNDRLIIKMEHINSYPLHHCSNQSITKEEEE